MIEEFINPTHPWSLLDSVTASVPPCIFMKGGGIGIGGLEMGRLMRSARQEGRLRSVWRVGDKKGAEAPS